MPYTFKEPNSSNGFTETQFGIQKAFIKALGDNIELVYKLKVLDGDHKDREFETTQRLFKNEDGSLSHPTYAGYTKKDGSEKAASLTYDILNAGREGGDDRFGKSFDTNDKDEVVFLKGLKFKMGYKMVTSKTSGSEYDFLNTSYQQLKDKEWAAEQARQENNKAVMEKAHAEAAANNDDELPF
jgi:hypothetical protein